MKSILSLVFVLAAAPTFAQMSGQAPAADPLSRFLKTAQDGVKNNIVRSAEKLDEADYGFRPAGVAAEVRTFGQFMGHIANANYAYCSRAKGEPNPNKADFEKVTAKADLVKALNEAFAYCDGVYGSLTDAKATTLMTVPGPNNTTRQIPAAAPLISNLSHNNEHYGNLVTYLRAKGIVPPSSERR